jgi:lon-related putative ATP-dependent protease
MNNSGKYRVEIDNLRKECKFEDIQDFCSTMQDVHTLEGVIGQDRAVQSMNFGLNMRAKGYNIFVLGPQGTGKSTYTQNVVSKLASNKISPVDWCYINNFDEWDKPFAISLPAGQGRVFQKDMDKLIKNLIVSIPKSYESSDFQHQKDFIVQKLKDKMNSIFKYIEQLASENGFSVQQTLQKILIIPKIDDKNIEPVEYNKLSDSEREKIDKKRNDLAIVIDEKLREGQMFQRILEEQNIELEKQIALTSAEPFVNQLKEKYIKFPRIINYLDYVLKDVSENNLIFQSIEHISNLSSQNYAQEGIETIEDDDEGLIDTRIIGNKNNIDPFIKYKVNLFINNEKTQGLPVIIENKPNYYNLFGKIEYKNNMMNMMTDFTMVKSGAIHKANGGYLILQAKDLLMDQYAWIALKKAMKYREIGVENIGEQSRYVPTVTLNPEPIPLDVKVIIIGSHSYYQLLSMDEDFKKLFKVNVDFDIEMDRNEENIKQYVAFVKSVCQNENLKHFNIKALAKVIELGSRLAGNQNKLSTRFNVVSEIIYESSAIAQTDGSELVDAYHVNKAIKDRKYRLNMLEEKLQEQILQEKVLIDTEGAVVGQVNGLTVMALSGYSFGLPSRITARTYMGREGVINIERETDMSGNIHSKGVLTLNGYLGGKLAQERPLGLTAQVTFEQLYGGIEGDSASSAELYAILSSLSGVPLKQNFAVTGSVNQMGEIQPIGGVNEKIEGFFDICKLKGLSGNQGVIIPVSNIADLMLKDEVLDAAKENLFHVFAVKSIEEGLEILSGVEAGEITEDGKYPQGSIFYLADRKLQEYNKILELAETQV